jgi:hypothetical protein
MAEYQAYLETLPAETRLIIADAQIEQSIADLRKLWVHYQLGGWPVVERITFAEKRIAERTFPSCA